MNVGIYVLKTGKKFTIDNNNDLLKIIMCSCDGQM